MYCNKENRTSAGPAKREGGCKLYPNLYISADGIKENVCFYTSFLDVT